MTLADFIKVFDFERFNLVIAYHDDYAINTYFSKSEVEHDYCTFIYTVLDIRPVDETTIQVLIWQ